MKVNRSLTDDGIEITLSNDDASALASVLGGVVDNSPEQSIDRLYTLLLDRHVVPDFEVHSGENENYDPEDDSDPFTHNLFIE